MFLFVFQFYQRVAYFLTELGNYSVPFVILLIYRINLHVHGRCAKKARIYMGFFYPAMWFIIMISRQIQLQVDCCFFFTLEQHCTLTVLLLFLIRTTPYSDRMGGCLHLQNVSVSICQLLFLHFLHCLLQGEVSDCIL